MKHNQLVKIGAKYARQRERCCITLTELTSTATESPDVLGWRSSGESVYIEVKVSRSDFLRDKKKHNRRDDVKGIGCNRYYLVPEGIITEDDLPLGWGLLVAVKSRVRRVVPAMRLLSDERQERIILISGLRRLGIKASELGDLAKTCSISIFKYETKNRTTLHIQKDGYSHGNAT